MSEQPSPDAGKMDGEISGAGAVIVAAGPSQRMGGTDKIWTPAAGRPLLAWVVQAFEAAPGIRDIALVVGRERIAEAHALRKHWQWHKVRAVVAGGTRRCDSVRAGVAALAPAREWVVVHDGARPLVTPELIEATLAAARTGGAASVCEPVKETIKRVRGGLVVETPTRAELALLQTPQAFSRALLAGTSAAWCPPEDDPPDEATSLLQQGIRVVLVPGGHENVRVTTPDEMEIVASQLRLQSAET